MGSFFEPDPVLLAFIFVKKFVWLEALAVLALLRLAIGGAAVNRWAAAAALVLCLLGSFAVFAPALSLNSGLIYARAGQAMAVWGGMGMALAASMLMIVSAWPGARWRWIDALHGLGLIGLLGLWGWVS